MTAEKNPTDWAAFGRLGGLKGGIARAARLTPKARRLIARMAANIRWERYRAERRKAQALDKESALP